MCIRDRSHRRSTTYDGEETRNEMDGESRSLPRPSQPTMLPRHDRPVENLQSKEDLELKSSKTHGLIQTFGREMRPANKMHQHNFSPAGSPCDEIVKRNASLWLGERRRQSRTGPMGEGDPLGRLNFRSTVNVRKFTRLPVFLTTLLLSAEEELETFRQYSVHYYQCLI